MSTPTGTVNIQLNGNGLTNIPLDANGQGSTTFTAGSAGTDTILGIYSGDTTHNQSQGTASEEVDSGMQNTTTTVTVSPNPALVGQQVTVSVVVANA